MSDLKVSLQLFSVRDEIEADLYGTLKAVKEMGYDYVQFSDFCNRIPEEIKAMLDELNLTCFSTHVSYAELLSADQKFIDGLNLIGVKYVALPWLGLEEHIGGEKWEQTVRQVNDIASLFKKGGITLLYHNHEHEFRLYEGKPLLDWLYKTVPSDLLQTEFDTCWVKYAGFDPCEYLKKYSGRSPVVHLKDFICEKYANAPDASKKEARAESRSENGFMLKPVGYGQQDFPAIIKASIEAGAEEIVVEQDFWPEHTAMEAARLSREYLKSIGY